MSQDRIYSMPLDRVGDFRFDDLVASVFPDMIARSVPGYASVLAMTAELAERYAVAGTFVYDLGCSLGAASILMQPRIPSTCCIHAVDSSEAMLHRLTRELQKQPSSGLAPIVPHLADVRDMELHSSSFAVLNFTLQFIPLEGRTSLLQSICNGLVPGGALVISEKVHFADPEREELMRTLHHDFKRANGYTDLEIAQKRTALENTLVTETVDEHLQRLTDVGFQTVSLWFQCFNFVSILAVK